MTGRATYPAGPVLGLLAAVQLSGCAVAAPEAEAGRMAGQTEYLGVETRLLDGDLVNFFVSAKGDEAKKDVVAYADCAAAQYALIRGFGFARHVRTNVAHEAGIWRADAVYTISPALPEGLRKLDAEVVVANCRDNGIPTV
ncbi:hypothetical protein Q4560_15265 [Celeribacter halophilus]|jgi:hypothetical protein|uniref:Lipoprotein n=1 Tax=Celeribacter halophilus TaxID=576117 RepID=A0AAW7XZU0_9RHOB|nr:hypothetical protein [Celeribacter halophilus]MDO6458115.1 hypothetical protein [Celeribacter halophilus]MDO6724630.1 hypothetical protein [Celeribacter halophilus]